MAGFNTISHSGLLFWATLYIIPIKTTFMPVLIVNF